MSGDRKTVKFMIGGAAYICKSRFQFSKDPTDIKLRFIIHSLCVHAARVKAFTQSLAMRDYRQDILANLLSLSLPHLDLILLETS